MSKDHSNHTRHAFRHPCGQAGQSKPCGSNRHDIQASRRTLSAMPSSMSSLHDNKRTGQWRPLGSHHCKLCLSSQNAIKVSCDQNQPNDWWSQTGSNRRPQACKASALPTELWPRPSGHLVIAKTGWLPAACQRHEQS